MTILIQGQESPTAHKVANKMMLQIGNMDTTLIKGLHLCIEGCTVRQWALVPDRYKKIKHCTKQ
jgi:hypothetical protein